MADRISRKSIKQDEFLEVASDAGAWVERHWRTAAAVVVAAFVLVLLVAAWSWWTGRRSAEVSRLLGEGLRMYAGAPGTAGAPGSPAYAEALAVFEEAARRGGSAPAGQVAAYYRGAALLRLGRAAEAVPVLEAVAAGGAERAVTDGARALLAEAYAASGQLDKAEAAYRVLADAAGGAFPPDVALLQLAGLLEERGRVREARQTLQEIVAKHPKGGAAGEARARLQAAP